jgi:hypothetical protein
MSLVVRPADSGSEFARFVDLPWRLYRNDPTWVPPLKADVRLLFDRAKNPFFEHAEVQPFLARKDGRVVGRIAAVANSAHNAFHEDQVGFFGCFECEDDPEAAKALFDAAEAWLAARGFDRMRGPMNFSTNDDCGSLVEGFTRPPSILMPHNPPYHARLYEAAGLAKAKDLIAYWFEGGGAPERLRRGVETIRKRRNFVVRQMDLKRFESEVGLIRSIYNSAWDKNWGFVPMTEHEIDHMAKQLRPIVVPELVLFAEVRGEPVAFALGLPNLNHALKQANGSLFPLGFLKIWWHSRHIHDVRVLTLGVKEGYRTSGVDALLYFELFERGAAKGYTHGEFSWILEDNLAMRRPLENMGAVPDKIYRVYERPVRRAAPAVPDAVPGASADAPRELAETHSAR